eukprot:GFUD01021406.1.p1 GENE.GFUD01021406.1~~GFUD01021406.1.p1  ORF type:complete len:753 (-),score=179.50 GFUD01021406.1:10-2268(-)
MNWRTADVFDVMGNRSMFSILSEKYKSLPPNTAFSIKSFQGETEAAGIFNLRDFVNGGAHHNLKMFLVEGTEEFLSLRSLLVNCGYKSEKEIISNSQNINIFLGQQLKPLKELTDAWKQDLIADSADQGMLRGAKFSKDVFSWLRSQAVCTPDEVPICMYCGFICYDQSPRGDFTGHMRRHLYRKRKCKKCNTAYMAGDGHDCGEVRSVRTLTGKSFKCAEPGCIKKYTSKEKLIWHLKIFHKIIERVVTMRECVFCTEMVPNLHSHYVEVHKNDIASCKYCDKTFANPTKYKQHIDTVHIKKYAGFCEICQKECASLMKHNVQVHTTQTYPCDHCDKIFKHEKSLDDHMKSVNGTMEKRQCPECSNFYVNVSDHIRRFHRGFKGPKQFKSFCGSCLKHIPHELYEEHKLTCIKEETICHICSKSVKYIENHLARKHQITRIQCGLCEMQLTVMGELNTHLRADHFPTILEEAGLLSTDLATEDRIEREKIAMKMVELQVNNTGENKYQCKFCNSETATGTQMLTHMKYHLGYNFKRGKEAKAVDSVCPMCGKMIKKYQKKAHKCQDRFKKKTTKIATDSSREMSDIDIQFSDIDVEIDLLSQECIDENKVTEKKKKSIEGSAGDVIRLPCDQCDRVFQRIANLRKHKIAVHENGNSRNEATFNCEDCKKEFKSIVNLKKHKLSVHDKVKYPCEHCDYKASDPSNLLKHRKTQHENVRYPCDLCDVIFTQSTNLNAHKKSKHSVVEISELQI